MFRYWLGLVSLLLILQVALVGNIQPEQVFIEDYAIPYDGDGRVRISKPFELTAEPSQGVRIAVTSSEDLFMVMTLVHIPTGVEEEFSLKIGQMDGVPTNGAWLRGEITLAGIVPGTYRLQMRVAKGRSSSTDAFQVKVFQHVVLWRYWALAMIVISIVPFAVWLKQRSLALALPATSPLHSI